MARPLDRDLRALLFSEEEARRRLNLNLWRRFYLPLIVMLVVVIGLAALAGAANAGGWTALAGAAAMYLALVGLVSGLALTVASVSAAGILEDAISGLQQWTSRARGIAALSFFRARSASDAVAHAITGIGVYCAVAEAGYRVLAETASGAWSVLMRKLHVE
jgi:hypothetical protein